MKNIILIIVSWFMAISGSGCALKSDVRILEDRVIALEMRNMELQQLTTESEREKKQIKSQIKNYSQTLDEKEQALRSQSASLHAMADNLRNEIQALKGKLEETEYLLSQKIKNAESSASTNSSRLKAVEHHLNISSSSGAGDPYSVQRKPDISSGYSSPPKAARTDYSEDELYIMAKQAFDQGKYDISREGFHEMLRKYPNAKHADSAQFWIGEIYYREKNYENAILEYQTVIEKYPKGNKVRASLLKQGFAFYNIGDKANARLILQELLSKYPGTPEANTAQKKLSSGF